MRENRHEAIKYAKDKLPRFLKDLQEFLKIQSISTDPDHNHDMENSCQWLISHFQKIGISHVQVLETAGHPCLYAEYMTNNENNPTLLIYGHYDVQPPEPIEKWLTPPFEPTIRDNNLYCRGASDMKGQIMASICAVEALLSQVDLPINIKFLLEGEEEIGSPNLDTVLFTNKGILNADVVLNPDAGMLSSDSPTITYGLRGLAYYELRIKGPKNDLHSGLFGGIIQNPAQVLCEIIAGMHDENGKIILPGFYKNVRELDQQERSALANLPVSEEKYIKQAGVKKLWGENNYSAIERIGARPTLEVNGLYSGFIEEGSKTIIPSYAMAKLSMRLVPDQDPDDVHTILLDYLKENIPDTVDWELIKMAGSPPSITDLNIPAVKSLADAFNETWGCLPVYRREGGSVPVVVSMQKILGVESVLTGFGLPDDNIHGPNEKLHLPTWEKGIYTLINFFYNYGSIK